MATEIVKNDDLFEKGLFAGDVKKNAEAFLKLLDVTEEKLIDVAKAYKQILELETGKTVKSIKNVTQATEALNDAEEQTQKIRTNRVKLQKQLNELNSDTIQDNEELKVQISEQRKINRQIAKESLGLVSTYQKQSKTLRDLRDRYKSLRLEEGKSTKETRELERQITKLDRELKDVDASAGQFQRNVGNYPKTLKDATKQFAKFTAGAIAAKLSLDNLIDSVESNEESADSFTKIQGGLSGAFSAAKNQLGGYLSSLFSAKGLIDLVYLKQLPQAEKNFSELTKEIIKSTIAGAEAAVENRNFRKELRNLNEELSIINSNIEKQNALAGDSTRSFNEIEEAIEQVNKLQIERSVLLETIAQRELDIIDKQIEARGEGANVQDLLNERSEKAIQLQEAQAELQLAQIENERAFREVQRDRFERELDFAIDAFDSVKTVNERQIADERLTLEQRRQILEETQSLTESSFANQIKLVQDFTNQNIDLNKLAQESNEEVIRSNLERFNFDDVTLGRILEIIRERKVAIQDLVEAQNDLTEAEREALELREDIIDQEVALQENSQESLDELERQRFNNTKTILEDRLDLVREGSLEELRIRKELNDLLLAENQRLLDLEEEQREKEKQKREEDLEQQQRLQEAALAAAEDIFLRRSERQLEALDNQIEASQERVDQLEEKARTSRLSAEESIAFERKQQAKAERERERQRQREQRTQALFTVLETFNKNDQNVQQTATDIAFIRGLVGTLTGFYDGTDDVGKSLGKPVIKGKDGYPIRVDGKEQIWSDKDRSQVGYKSRQEIIDIVNGKNDVTKIIASDSIRANEVQNKAIIYTDERIVSGINQMNRSLNRLSNEKEKIIFDYINEEMIYERRVGKKVIRNHKKLR